MYQAPGTDSILEDLRNSVKTEVAGTDPWIWPNNLVPVLKAIAQGLRGAYLRLEFVHQQAFVTTATGEYLDYHGIQAGGLSRSPAKFAQGNVNVTAVLGTVIPDSIQFARSDGKIFQSIGTTTVTKSPMTMFVKAMDVGEIYNTDQGATLTPLTTIAGVTSCIVATGGLIGGTEEESDDSFRQRILYYKQNPPHGGSPSEYVEWAQTKVGVTRVFVMRATPQPGSVTIYFMMDGVGNGIPTDADVAELLGIFQQLAPEDAEVIVKKPTPQPINVTITGLVPDTPDVRNQAVEELKAMFIRQAEPAETGQPFTFARSWIDEAVAMTPKWRRSSITTPSADVVVTTAGNIPTLGTVTFT